MRAVLARTWSRWGRPERIDGSEPPLRGLVTSIDVRGSAGTAAPLRRRD